MESRSRPIQDRSTAAPYEPPSPVRMILLAVSLFALALPIVGPLDDHHFAERSHTHGHVYLDGRAASHQHEFELSARHRHPAEPQTGRARHLAPATGEIAYFTDPAGSLTLAVLNAPAHKAPEALRPASPPRKNENPLTPFSVRYREPVGHHVVPRLPPPIA